MLLHSLPRTTRSLARPLCVAALALTFAGQALAGDPIPQFKDADVTAYAKSYSEFTDDYIAAIKASKTGDMSKLSAMTAKTTELQTKAQQMAVKLKPEETEKFTTFIAACARKMADAATQ